MNRLRPSGMPHEREQRAESVVSTALSTPTLVDITIPRTSVKAKLRIVSRAERFNATAEARRALADGGIPVDATAVSSLGALEQWNYEFAVRILAVAVRDPARPERALEPLESWRDCDDDQIEALWSRYQDLEAELDPLGGSVTLSTEDQLAIEGAAKKGDAALLMSFGSQKLALFVTTSVARPASSATPTS